MPDEMKKTILFFIAILFGVSLTGQSGDGLTPATAYYGTITTARTWTFAYNGGTIYVGPTGNEDLTITTGGSLTIEAGVTVIFCTTGSDLRITGTGSLTAIGNSSAPITFTKLSSISTWGHLSFEGSTGISQLTYCLIENGYKSGTGVEGYGGGIYINCNNLTLTNCSIRYNFATYGGGIYVNSSSPHIINCSINNNTAQTTGGGILFDLNCPSIVENCIIANNLSNGSGGGGGVFAGDNVGNLQFFNCDIISNTTTSHNGNNIRFYRNVSSPYPVFQNCIVWGSNNGIMFTFSANQASIFVNCGIMGDASAYTNCISLNAVNNDPAGPNFYNVTPGSEDYRITFVSPLRDAGLSTGAPLTDILGNSRVGPYDIGAYEVQISGNLWIGTISTDWFTSGNWASNSPPPIRADVVIGPSAHNPILTANVRTNNLTVELSSALTISAGVTLTSTSVQNNGTLTINAGAIFNITSLTNSGTFIIQPGGQSTATGLLTNNGLVDLNSDNTAMFSFIFNSYSGSGTVNSQIYFTGGDAGSRQFRWHYVAVPASMSKSVFTNINQFDLLRYDDSRITGLTPNKEMGWQWHDGWNGSTTVPADAFATLDVTRGYNFYNATPVTATLTSTSLLSDLGTVNMQYSGTAPDDNIFGWNLVGNSLTCSIDWNNVDWSNGGQINNAVYFTRDNAVAAFVDGTGINGGSQFIPPLQGFFVQTRAGGQSINFTGTNVHSGQSYFKGKGSDATPQVRFEIWQGSKQDETVIRLKDESTNLFDGKFDASKWLSGAGIAQIYTHLPPGDYSINTIPFPKVLTEIPVSIVIPADGTYSIQRTTLQGLDNYNVTLTDNTTGLITDLKSTSTLSFSATAGTTTNRFVIKISNISTGVENPVISNNKFNIFPSNGMLNIQTFSDEWDGKSGSVKVIDLTGKTISDRNNTEFSKNSLVQVAAPVTKGIYIVEIKSGVLRYVGKVVIR
jgi:hypothetical protein